METSCLEHCLTGAEQDQFNERGFLIVEDALNDETIERLIEAVDRVDSRERGNGYARHQLLSMTNIIPEDIAFLELIDWPCVFPKVWAILGWNIYLYHSHLDVTPPADAGTSSGNVAWHQDSMRVNDEIETHPRPRLSLKVGYYLTDVSDPERGNTMIVPGSHLQDELDCPADGFSNPAGAEPVCVKPGSALLLDRRLWHSRSTNTSDITRKVLWYGYSYRWLRPKDEMTVKDLYPQLDPIRRQILGDGLSAGGCYDPADGDVPLRTWLKQHRPSDANWSHHDQRQSRPPDMARARDADPT